MSSEIQSIVQEAVQKLGGSKKSVDAHVGHTNALIAALKKRFSEEQNPTPDQIKEIAIQVFNKTVLAENAEMTIRQAHKGYANLFAEGFARLVLKQMKAGS